MAAPAQVKETHVSWLLFLGERVYKIKKPKSFPFLDWTSVAAREEACRMEVSLNRRLSPDAYIGVGHFRAPDGSEEPVVVMRRMDADRSLSALIRRGDDSLAAWVLEIAVTLAEFHGRAQRGAEVDRDCGPDAVRTLWQTNLTQLRSVTGPSAAGPLDEVERMGLEYLAGRKVLLEQRVAGGRAVDGHGDLLCDDIFCNREGLRILDCLEFDPVLRHGDVVADIGSLAMDLERHGRPDLSRLLIEEYQRRSGDRWPCSLTDFWVAYRALVRAKVGRLRVSELAAAEAGAQAREVDGLLALARAHLRQGRVRVVIVGGLPGTGKTTLARNLSESTGWRLLGTDLMRRRTAGVGPAEDTLAAYGEGLYTPELISTNYRAMIEAAGRFLRSGESVVLDASWTRETWRREARRMARRSVAEVTEIECVAPADVARDRIVARLGRGETGPGVSDATPEVARAMAGHRDPWPEATTIDTGGPEADAVAAALDTVRP